MTVHWSLSYLMFNEPNTFNARKTPPCIKYTLNIANVTAAFYT